MKPPGAEGPFWLERFFPMVVLLIAVTSLLGVIALNHYVDDCQRAAALVEHVRAEAYALRALEVETAQVWRPEPRAALEQTSHHARLDLDALSRLVRYGG
ncbi:MAG: hypothetical protein C4333_09045 [Meiothermus sp.]